MPDYYCQKNNIQQFALNDIVLKVSVILTNANNFNNYSAFNHHKMESSRIPSLTQYAIMEGFSEVNTEQSPQRKVFTLFQHVL